MDSNLLSAIVTTAGSTTVAVVAILTQNKRIDRIEKKFDDLEATMKSGFEGVNTRIDLLTGSFHDVDKRLGILEDRSFNRGEMK